MFKPYAYSFDRETFRGEFATRESAAEAGLKAAIDHPATIGAVYVGKRVPVDPQADQHAEDVARTMRRRMQSKTGTSGYLVEANEHVMADLDASLEHAIVEWLKRHDLMPAPQIASISEHPLPAVKAHAPSRVFEVGPMGGEE
jgi:hypothetical protein